MKKKIVALIMARGKSKSIPNKNIVPLNGFPLISWSIAACKLSKCIDEIIVSTDSKKIGMVAKKYGAQVPFLRPKVYAKDKSTDYEVFNHFIKWWDKKRKDKIKFIVQIRPTTPYRDPIVIDKAIKMISKKKCSGLRSVYEMSETSWKTFEINKKKYLTPLTDKLFNYKGLEKSNLPRQMLPKTYFGQGYVDIVKPETIKQGLTYGKRVLGFVVPDVGEIDTKSDFIRIKRLNIFKPLKIYKFLKSKK